MGELIPQLEAENIPGMAAEGVNGGGSSSQHTKSSCSVGKSVTKGQILQEKSRASEAGLPSQQKVLESTVP